MNSGVCVKGSCYNDFERDYYGMLTEILELTYYGAANKVVLFKCDWYDTERGIRVHRDHGLVDVRYKSRLNTNEPFILAQQAQQVYYTTYPCKSRETDGWWAVCKAKARNSFNIPSANTSNINVSPDIDIYQEDEITNLSIVQADEDLDIPNLLVDFSQYEMLNDDELLKLQQRLEEAVVEDEEEEEQDGEDAEDEEEDEFEDNIDESTEEENEFELSTSEND